MGHFNRRASLSELGASARKLVLCWRNCFLWCVRLCLVPWNSLSSLGSDSKTLRKCFCLIPFFLVRGLDPRLNPGALALPTTLHRAEELAEHPCEAALRKATAACLLVQWDGRKEKQSHTALPASHPDLDSPPDFTACLVHLPEKGRKGRSGVTQPGC